MLSRPDTELCKGAEFKCRLDVAVSSKILDYVFTKLTATSLSLIHWRLAFIFMGLLYCSCELELGYCISRRHFSEKHVRI